MNEFKAIDLSNDKKTIFHSWKIKEGSTLSIGKVIFLYENSTETASKYRYRRVNFRYGKIFLFLLI